MSDDRPPDVPSVVETYLQLTSLVDGRCVDQA